MAVMLRNRHFLLHINVKIWRYPEYNRNHVSKKQKSEKVVVKFQVIKCIYMNTKTGQIKEEQEMNIWLRWRNRRTMRMIQVNWSMTGDRDTTVHNGSNTKHESLICRRVEQVTCWVRLVQLSTDWNYFTWESSGLWRYRLYSCRWREIH